MPCLSTFDAAGAGGGKGEGTGGRKGEAKREAKGGGKDLYVDGHREVVFPV